MGSEPVPVRTGGALERLRVWGLSVIGLGYLSTLALHAYLGTYSRFIADDYCSAGMASRFGILRAIWYWYLNWTGRYAASALDASFGLMGPGVTSFVTSLVLLLWLGVLALAVASFAPNHRRHGSAASLIIALTLLYLTLVFSPSVPQSLYWGQGMRSIVPPLVLSAIYAAAVERYGARERSKGLQAIWLAACLLLTFLIGGFNETFTALELSILLLASLVALANQSNGRHRGLAPSLAAGALGAGLAFMVIVIAPGNAFRQAYYPPPPDLIRMLSIAGGNFAAFLVRTFGQSERLLAIVGAVAVSIFLGLHLGIARPRIWGSLLILAGGMAFAFLCFLPAAYGLSDAPPDRTLMIPAHLLAIALTLASLMAGSWLTPLIAGLRWRTAAEAFILIVAAVLALGSVALSNGELLANRATYAQYASAWDLMNAQIIQARSAGQHQIQIPPKVNWAGLDEPNDNPKFWVNVCYRQYYGLEVLAESPP